jgi:hypothetical protein
MEPSPSPLSSREFVTLLSGYQFFLGTRTPTKTKLSSRPERSEVEGPAVLSTSHRTYTEALPSPLSSSEFVTLFSEGNFSWELAPPLKYELSSRPKRSEVEGSAVRSIDNQRLMETLSSPLSSRAKPRALQFYKPLLEMFFDRANDCPTPPKSRVSSLDVFARTAHPA